MSTSHVPLNRWETVLSSLKNLIHHYYSSKDAPPPPHTHTRTHKESQKHVQLIQRHYNYTLFPFILPSSFSPSLLPFFSPPSIPSVHPPFLSFSLLLPLPPDREGGMFVRKSVLPNFGNSVLLIIIFRVCQIS